MRDLKNYGHINVMNAIIEKLADLTEKKFDCIFLFFIEEFRKSVYSIYFLHNFLKLFRYLVIALIIGGYFSRL